MCDILERGDDVLALATTLGVKLSASAVRGALHQLHLRWGRPRLGMPLKVDPQKADKQWRIAKAVIEAGPEAVILYGDESRCQLLPLIRACWHWLGQQIRVPTPGTNQSRALFGALDIRSGRWVYLVRERMLKEDFIAFLDHLLVQYPGVAIVLILDNFGSHTAAAVQAWLLEHKRLSLLYLRSTARISTPLSESGCSSRTRSLPTASMAPCTADRRRQVLLRRDDTRSSSHLGSSLIPSTNLLRPT